MRTFTENYLHFMKNCKRPLYEKLKSLKSGFIENSIFENNRDPCEIVYFQYLLVGSSQCQRLEDLALGGWRTILRASLLCLALTPCYHQIVQT